MYTAHTTVRFVAEIVIFLCKPIEGNTNAFNNNSNNKTLIS